MVRQSSLLKGAHMVEITFYQRLHNPFVLPHSVMVGSGEPKLHSKFEAPRLLELVQQDPHLLEELRQFLGAAYEVGQACGRDYQAALIGRIRQLEAVVNGETLL